MTGSISTFFAELTGLATLLVCGLLAYRAFPQRYLLAWNAAWVVYLGYLSGSVAAPEYAQFMPLLLLVSQALVLAGVGLVASRKVPPVWLVAAVAAAWLADLGLSRLSPGATGWIAGLAYFLFGATAMFWIMAEAKRHDGYSTWMLATALALRLPHPGTALNPGDWLGIGYDMATSMLALAAMLLLTFDRARQSLRWNAAPGLIVSSAADFASPHRFGSEALERIADAIRNVFEPAFCRLHLLTGDASADREAHTLLSWLPQSAGGSQLCTTLIEPSLNSEAASWLSARSLRWAIIVPIPQVSASPEAPIGLFVLGYRRRRWLAPGAMQALVATGRHLGIVLDNTRLLRQLSHAYREWVNTMDAIGDLVLVHDSQFRIQRANKALAERTGQAPAELIQRTCREVLSRAASGDWTDCPFCELPPGGDTYFEGMHGYFLVSTSRYPKEEPTGVLHVVKDITDRKLAEEKYRTMFETVREGVFISSVAGRFLDLNEAMAAILGYSREELMQIEDIAHLYAVPEERSRYLALIQQQGYVSDYELHLRRKDGDVRICLETSFGIRDESGKIRQFQGFLLDITARKQAEQELHDHVTRLSAINQLAGQLTASLEVEKLLKLVAQELRSIFGFDSVSAFVLDAARSVACRVAHDPEPDDQAPPLEVVVPAELLGAVSGASTPLLRVSELPLSPDSVARLMRSDLATVYLMPLKSGDFAGALTLGWTAERKLTMAEENLLAAVARQLQAAIEKASLYQQTRKAYEELRLTQEQLLQSEKMAAIGQLVSGVAHELNNPLTAIIGYVQLLGTQVTGKGAEYVDKLLHQARRTQRIIQNLLSFARQRKPERQHADINMVLEEALLLREYDLRISNVQIQRNFAPELPLVHADTHQLEQVFLNIINNASDALREKSDVGGTLRVRTQRLGEQVVVEFSDDGPGMAEPARVFDPFYTTKSVGKGTGLGLSICYGIIKEHGGEIRAENRAEGGAKFTVCLPTTHAATAVNPV